MVTYKDGAQNFPECGNAELIVNTAAMWNEDWSTNTTTGYRTLAALEN